MGRKRSSSALRQVREATPGIVLGRCNVAWKVALLWDRLSEDFSSLFQLQKYVMWYYGKYFLILSRTFMEIESTLLEKIARKDESAFRVVYESYYPKVYTYALKYLKSEAEAEEIVDEVFLKLWLRDSNALPVKNLNYYLQTLTRNRCLDVLRRKMLENRVDLRAAITWHEDHNETEELILMNDTKKVIEKGIALLPPQQKQVYQMCREEGLKYEQVAERLQLSPATVQTHMKLALKFLRAYVQQHTDIAALLIILRLF